MQRAAIEHPDETPLPSPDSAGATTTTADAHPDASDLASRVTGPSVARMVLDAVSEGILCIDMAGLTTFVNPAAARMTGWTREELLGSRQHGMMHHSHADATVYPWELSPIYKTLRDSISRHCEDEVFWRSDGSSFPVSYTSTPIFIDDAPVGAVVNFQDISQRVRRDLWQRNKNKVLKAIAANEPLRDTLQTLAEACTECDPGCSVAILLHDKDVRRHLFLVAGSCLSPQLEARLKLVAVDFDQSADPASNYSELTASLADHCLTLPMIATDGEPRGAVVFFHGAPNDSSLPPPAAMQFDEIDQALYRSLRDIAQIAVETHKLHLSLIHQAEHDHLTGLPNRLLFEDRLTHALRASDTNHRSVAVCLIDIDRFRRVNENFGHLTGDELLQQIAGRLKRGMRSIDTLARETGDEFLVLLPEIGSAPDAEIICRRLLLGMDSAFNISGINIIVSVSIGIALYPDHAVTAELLIQNAHTAVLYARAKGQGKLQIFRTDLGERVRLLAIREAALATAIEKNELYLMYQPLYDADRRLHGFEALCRWNSPDLGMIPPDQFIPLAESTGLIISIGEWVLNEACRQAMAWKVQSLKETKIFVNVSALQLGQVDFTSTVSKALRLSGLPPSRLELEVTESLIVSSFKKATARLQPLQSLGVSIAIDDFGTGHSSFGVLHKLPIDAIKVDRSFVARIDCDPSGLSTVRAIVELARQLGMKTVGEGVETEEQFRLLQEMQCDYFQGYLFSRPLTPEAAHLLFENAPANSGSPDPLRISA